MDYQQMNREKSGSRIFLCVFTLLALACSSSSDKEMAETSCNIQPLLGNSCTAFSSGGSTKRKTPSEFEAEQIKLDVSGNTVDLSGYKPSPISKDGKTISIEQLSEYPNADLFSYEPPDDTSAEFSQPQLITGAYLVSPVSSIKCEDLTYEPTIPKFSSLSLVTGTYVTCIRLTNKHFEEKVYIKTPSLVIVKSLSEGQLQLVAAPKDGNSIELSWGTAPSAEGYLLIRKKSSSPSFAPTDGQSYAAGFSVDDQEIVYIGSENKFIDFPPVEEMYYYTLYHYDSDIHYSLPNHAEQRFLFSVCAHPSMSTFEGHCYVAIDSIKDWNEAKADCTNRGAYLTSITSVAENSFVASLITKVSFIGANDSASEGTWVWDNGEPLTFTNWRGVEEPNNGAGLGFDENCVSMDLGATWNDRHCDFEISSYICEATK